MKKKLLLISAVAMGLLSGFSACSKKGTSIGILLPVEHEALNKAKDGFISGLKEMGYEVGKNININYINAAGNSNDLLTGAKELVDTCALSLGVGTGASQALLAAERNASYTKPLLFTAVTDAVDAGLVSSNDNTDGFCCGTIDANPVAAQIELIKEIKPSASKIGIIYTQSETNSIIQANQAEAAAQSKGMTVSIKTCTGPSDITSTAEALASETGMDAIYVPTDNNIAANMNAIKQAADNHSVYVIAGEEGMLTRGGHFTLSINYFNLGVTTGKMAAQILSGEKKTTDFKVSAVPASDCEYVYSSSNLTSAGLVIPSTVISAHTWRDINA